MMMTIAIGIRTDGTIIAALESPELDSLTGLFRFVVVVDVSDVEPDVGSAPKVRKFYKSVD